jgi:hypothetical protein
MANKCYNIFLGVQLHECYVKNQHLGDYLCLIISVDPDDDTEQISKMMVFKLTLITWENFIAWKVIPTENVHAVQADTAKGRGLEQQLLRTRMETYKNGGKHNKKMN